MALSFFLILLPGLPVKNSLPVEQTHSANIISFSIYENENEPRLDDFLPLFVCFGTKIFSQHQISTTLLGLVRENRATPVLTRSLVRSPTSTPKPRAEGSSPSAPAKKERQASACLSFFVSAHKDSATRHGCAPAQCVSWGPAARWAASRPDRGDSRDKSFCPCQKTGENTGFSPVCFFHVLHGFWVHFGSVFWFPHLSTPAAPLPSTRNAPGFAFFGLFRVRFAVFPLF